jgi:hypothetical protein
MNTKTKIYYTLRFAAAMCFIGHGAFGIITKQVWCNYFGVFGIGSITAYKLMPVVGSIDILLGISILFHPTKAAFSWLVVWGLFTAFLRPLSGEAFAEVIERGGNYGVPLALLLLCGNGKIGFNNWFQKLELSDNIEKETNEKVEFCLKIVVCLLLSGHGWLNLIEKKSILSQYAMLGFSSPGFTAQIVGLFEIAAALVVLVRPLRSVLLFLFIWKMATELFYPHWELFEWIERGGSYGAILSLWFIQRNGSMATNQPFLNIKKWVGEIFTQTRMSKYLIYN